MTTLAPAALHAPSRRRLGFATAAMSLVAVFAASGAPIPLYERYRAEAGLAAGDLSIAAVSYFIAVMIALVILGRLSDHLGRKTVSITAVLLATAGSLTLLHVSGLGVLVAGRVLHGLACGLASAALTAYVVDLAPARPAWIAATAAAGSPLIGLTLGALGTGAFAEYDIHPERAPYLAVAGVLIVCGVFLVLSPETVAQRPGALTSLRPRVHVPRTIRPLLPAAIAVFCGTWALGGFYQAYSPTISTLYLGTNSVLIGGIVFASFLAPYAFGGPLTGRLAPTTAQRGGIVVFALAILGIVIGLYAGSVLAVIACSMAAGAAQGAAFTGTMRDLLARTSAADRAALMSTVYLFSYGGAAIPSLLAGSLTSVLDLRQISIGYAAFAALAATVTLVCRPAGVEVGNARAL